MSHNKEIQSAIDNKDWGSLSKVSRWDFDQFIRLGKARIPKYFFLEFLKHERAEHVIHKSCGTLLSFMNNLDFSYDDYREMFKFADKSHNITLFDMTKDKTQAFLEFYIDNSDRIIELRDKIMYRDVTVASFTKKLLGDGSLNKRFAEVLNGDINAFRREVHGGVQADAAGLQFLKEYASNDLKLELLESEPSTDPEVLRIATEAASGESITDYICRRNSTDLSNVFSNLGNVGYEFSDKLISDIVHKHAEHAAYVMTKEQIANFNNELGITSIINSNKLELDELADIFP